MSAEALPPLGFSPAKVDTLTLYQEGRTPILCPLSEEERRVVAIVPDKPLRPGIRIHWQIDPEDPGRIIFADLTGKREAPATLYLLPYDKAAIVAETVKYVIKGT